jgi:hypothetical protein
VPFDPNDQSSRFQAVLDKMDANQTALIAAINGDSGSTIGDQLDTYLGAIQGSLSGLYGLANTINNNIVTLLARIGTSGVYDDSVRGLLLSIRDMLAGDLAGNPNDTTNQLVTEVANTSAIFQALLDLRSAVGSPLPGGITITSTIYNQLVQGQECPCESALFEPKGCTQPYISSGISAWVEIVDPLFYGNAATWHDSVLPSDLVVSDNPDVGGGVYTLITADDWTTWNIYVASDAKLCSLTAPMGILLDTNKWFKSPITEGPLCFTVASGSSLRVWLCRDSDLNTEGLCVSSVGTIPNGNPDDPRRVIIWPASDTRFVGTGPERVSLAFQNWWFKVEGDATVDAVYENTFYVNDLEKDTPYPLGDMTYGWIGFLISPTGDATITICPTNTFPE